MEYFVLQPAGTASDSSLLVYSIIFIRFQVEWFGAGCRAYSFSQVNAILQLRSRVALYSLTRRTWLKGALARVSSDAQPQNAN